VLARLKEFVPALRESNDALERKLSTDPSASADIEVLTDPDAPHIEMVRGRRVRAPHAHECSRP